MKQSMKYKFLLTTAVLTALTGMTSQSVFAQDYNSFSDIKRAYKVTSGYENKIKLLEEATLNGKPIGIIVNTSSNDGLFSTVNHEFNASSEDYTTYEGVTAGNGITFVTKNYSSGLSNYLTNTVISVDSDYVKNIVTDTLDDATLDKADKSLSNLTDTGKSIVKDLAHEALDADLDELDKTLTNKGLNFVADTGTYHSNLGGTVSINGDGKNISTEFTNNSVSIKLSDDLNVNSVTAKTVTADSGNFKNLTADKGNITELTANTVDAKTVTADTGTFKNLTADKGNITELTANTVDAKTVTADTGAFKTLTADTSNITDLTVNTIKVGNGETYLTPDGLDANHHKIINVADGTERTDAVNYGQLTDATNNLSNKMNAGMSKLGNQIKNVGANAAALAALHPQDFDEDYKLSIAAGVGNYKDKNGTAIGAFYRPNEDVMFSVAGTFGDDAMVNAGISYKFGHSDSSKKIVSTSALDAINKKLDELADENARLRSQNERLLNLIYKIKPIRKSFPDVPADHWANEAVETLHGNDVLEGYPDGEFKGDKTMSRYEYAQMLYKAAKK